MGSGGRRFLMSEVSLYMRVFAFNVDPTEVLGIQSGDTPPCRMTRVTLHRVVSRNFGMVTGKCPYVLSDFPRWREVVVFANC